MTEALGSASNPERQDEPLDHGVVARDAVDRDADDRRAAVCELVVLASAADQLPVAVGSPVPAQEQQHDRISEMIGEAPAFAALVSECEVEREIGHDRNRRPDRNELFALCGRPNWMKPLVSCEMRGNRSGGRR